MIYRALAARVDDPSNRGRIKVMIPSLTGEAISEWIWPIITGGYLVVPRPGEQVWVMFENGDQDSPVWLGKTQEESNKQQHPSAPWTRKGGPTPPADLEERVTLIEEFLGLRSA